MFRTRSRAGILALLTATATALAGCGPIATTRTGGSGANPAASAATGPVAETSAGSGQGGAGTVTASITEPVQASGHAGASVTCTSGARTYTAQAQSVVVSGYKVSFTVRVAPYTGGSGTYQSLVTMRLDGATGAVTTVSGLPQVPATITDSGGSYQINATGQNGRSLAATIEWKCS